VAVEGLKVTVENYFNSLSKRDRKQYNKSSKNVAATIKRWCLEGGENEVHPSVANLVYFPLENTNFVVCWCF
jgi:hypothetical protein